MKIEWSSLYKKEDWWAVWLGFLILALVTTNIFSNLPKIHGWTTDPSIAMGIDDVINLVILGLCLLTITSIAISALKHQLKSYIIGFPVMFLLAFLAILVSKQSTIGSFGLAYALWALIIGLLISNTIGLPKWLGTSVKTELYIKIGLVVLGAEILFDVILKASSLGLYEVTIGLAMVWYVSYFVARKLALSKSFAAIMSTATSVCGVSAAIASGGAVKGDKKEVGYVVSLVLLFSGPMMVLLPVIGRMLRMPDAVFGAWVGGCIDNTASVVASGSLYSEEAMAIASIIKMSQNIMIGVTAFLLALYWTLKVERKPNERPKKIEIWYRFPKFILGFIIASLVFSLLLNPVLGASSVQNILNVTKGFRKWFFALTFVSIGLETKFKDLIKIGKGRPLIAFIIATVFDVIVTLISAYVFFGGTLFPTPI